MKWLLLAKPWLLPTTALLAGVAVGGIWWHGYQTGQTRAEAQAAQALDAARTAQERLGDELEQARRERQPEIRERVRYVDRVVDDCADAPVPDGVFGALGGRDG